MHCYKQAVNTQICHMQLCCFTEQLSCAPAGCQDSTTEGRSAALAAGVAADPSDDAGGDSCTLHSMLLQGVSAGALPPPGRATHMLRQPRLLLLLLWFAAACWHTAAKGSNTARCMTDSTSPPACKA
jgi:hypothetical protein